MAKAKPGEKRLFLSFTEPEDLALYDRLVADAKKQRYPLGTYVMLVLLAAYPESGKVAENQPASPQ
jgi:hypothetical protein